MLARGRSRRTRPSRVDNAPVRPAGRMQRVAPVDLVVRGRDWSREVPSAICDLPDRERARHLTVRVGDLARGLGVLHAVSREQVATLAPALLLAHGGVLVDHLRMTVDKGLST